LAAVDFGREQLGQRFLLLNYDALCLDPLPHIRELLLFLCVPSQDASIERLIAIPQVPQSMGRHRSFKLGDFGPDALERVQRLGFEMTSEDNR